MSAWTRDSEFTKYWVGQTISDLGSSVTKFALPLIVYKVTNSAIDLGISSATIFLPYLLFGLFLGAWADRVNRKSMMIAMDIARALVIVSIPLQAMSGHLSVWWIYTVSFIHSTLSICFEAGQFAAIPCLVKKENLVQANGKVQAFSSGAQILGPVLAGLLISFFPYSLLLFIDAASFFISAFSLLLIRSSFNDTVREGKEKKHLGQDVIEGLRYVFSHPVLRNISIMMALVNFVNTTSNTQLVLFAKTRLLATDGQVGLLYSASSIGVVLLSLMAGPLRKRWPFSKVVLGTLMLSGFLTIILATTTWYLFALILWGGISGLRILFNINTSSLRQEIVPNHLLGRVVSTASVLAWSAIPLGSLVGGVAINSTNNIELVYGVIGGFILVIALLFSFSALGHAEDYLPLALSWPSQRYKIAAQATQPLPLHEAVRITATPIPLSDSSGPLQWPYTFSGHASAPISLRLVSSNPTSSNYDRMAMSSKDVYIPPRPENKIRLAEDNHKAINTFVKIQGAMPDTPRLSAPSLSASHLSEG